MLYIKAIIAIIVNCIIYFSFGSLICAVRNTKWSASITMVVGFFTYYALFALVCIPIMLVYRPLELLSKTWLVVVALVFIVAVLVCHKTWGDKFKQIRDTVTCDKRTYVLLGLIVLIQVILVTTTYNFTLDAAYYVANVATSVDTNMINVYDPFTGAWQDHFELRYVFATYSIQDAVWCQLTGIPALVQTKTVMSAVVMIIVNCMYIWICRFLCKDNKQTAIMYVSMVFVNMTFITIYTSANFLFSRTYEGKSVVGNITVIAIFVMYMLAVREGMNTRSFIMLFAICLGTATVSSTANMLVPAELCVLFVPYIIKHRTFKMIPKLIICMMPEILMLLMYVLYVKGYYAIYTYPR